MTTLGLPDWPALPEPVDATGRSWLVVVCGGRPAAEVGAAWVAEAELLGPTRLVAVAAYDAPGSAALAAAYDACRTGVRIMVAGNEHDVLLALALARARGAGAAELRSFVVPDGSIPVFCAHCRDTRAVVAAPGGTVDCPGCRRHLEVHQHHSALRGSYLGSDARARELV